MTPRDDRAALAEPSRRPWLRRVLGALLVVVLVALVWTGVVLLRVRGDLTEAQAGLTRATGQGSLERPQAVAAALDDAHEDLSRASGRLRQPGPRLVARLPLVGRVVRAPQAVAEAGVAVTRSGAEVLRAVEQAPLQQGRVPLDQVVAVHHALAQAVERTAEPVDELLAVERGGLPGPVARGVEQAQGAVAGVPDSLARARDAAAALHGVLGGSAERQVLVVVLNGAEQRGAGGLVSVFAQGTARDGRLELDTFRDVADVADPAAEARRVPAPDDYHDLWGRYLADTTLWRNASMSPHGPASLGVLADVARVSTGRAADVVITLDVPAIAAVLDATGPTRLPDGTTLTGDNAVEHLLLTAYTRFPDDAAGQTRRREVLRVAADAVLTDLLEGDVDAAELVRALAPAATGRHIMLWSARPEEQELLESAGLSGELRANGGDVASAATQNFGQSPLEGNKLDYFVRRLHEVEVVVGRDQAEVTETFSLRNTAPVRGLPGYVIGYSRPGELTTMVALSLPRAAALLGFTRDGTALGATPEPQTDHQVVRDVARVPAGSTSVWVVRYRLPLVEGGYRLRAVPQPLAVAAGLSVRLRAAEGLRLTAPPGAELEGDELVVSGPFTATHEVRATAERPPRLQRMRDAVRRFWNEPVRLP